MDESGLAAIGKFVMRNRQYLGCLRVRGRALTLEQLYFADEVDDPADVVPARLPAVGKRELQMALNLIDGFSAKWDPNKYKDNYTAALRRVVKAKLKGEEIHRAPEPEAAEMPDLMEALRESVAHAKHRRRTTRGGRKASPSTSRPTAASKGKPKARAASKAR
jgi:DNA end-binding protein Ku